MKVAMYVGAFLGVADSERIEVFDGINTRAVKATPVDFGFTAAQREEAKSPGMSIPSAYTGLPQLAQS